MRYDDRSRLVFHFAREEGTRLGHTVIGPEHLLLGLLREGGTACAVLNDFGVTLDEACYSVLALTGWGSARTANDTAEITPSARTVTELAGLDIPEPVSDDDSPRLRFNPGGWDETYLGTGKLSPMVEVKLGLRLLGRGARHLLLGR